MPTAAEASLTNKLMLFTCFNHQLNKNQTLGFLPNRFVYDAEVPEGARDVKGTIRDTAAEQGVYEKRKAELIPYKETVNQTWGNVSTAIEDYNQYIQEKHFDLGLWPFTDWKTFVFFELDELPSGLVLNESRINLKKLKDGIKTLKGDSSASPPIPSKIDNLITPALYTEDFQEYRDKLNELLTKIEAQITAYEEALRKAAEAQEKFEREVLQGHGQNLVERHRLMMDHVEERTGFEKEPVYQRLQTKFDLALRDPKLSALGDRQMRQLFFSMLAQNTEGFKDTVNKGFLLGPDFGSNWQKNRARFPFLYNAWMEHNGVNEEAAQEAEQIVASLETALKTKPQKSVEELIASEVRNNIVSDKPLKALATPPSGLAEDLLVYHQNRREAINHLRHEYLRKASQAVDDPRLNTPEEKTKRAQDLREKAKTLAQYVEFEEAQIKLYRIKSKEDAKEMFTREHLTAEGNERWLLEVAMKQFIRAANIVDYPNGKQSASQADMYHPAVRRMMIAMVYREGTARWAPDGKDGKYDDAIADEYTGMLSELAKSPDFNINLRGKFFLNEKAKNYLLLARYSNLMRIRVPELTKEVAVLAAKFDAAKKATVLSTFGINLDTLGAYNVEKVKVEPKLIEVGLPYKKQQTKDKLISGATRTILTPLGINPDDSDANLETAQRTNVNAILAPATPPTTPFTAPQIEAAKAMLAYINEVKRLNDLNAAAPTVDKTELIEAGKTAGARNLNPDAALANEVLKYLTERERLALYQADAARVDQYVRDQNYVDPATGQTATDFLKTLRERPGVEGPTENARVLGDWTSDAQAVELHYNAFDTQENSRMDIFDRMGISIKGLHQKYLDYIKANPEMREDQWLKYLRSDKPEDFKKLVDMFRAIIPESEGGGKLDFLITFENWHRSRGREKTSENLKQETLALFIYHGLAAHIRQAEGIAAASARGEQEVVAKMEGMNIGEKFTKYGKGVLNLLIGPGQPLANRAAGMVLLYGAWKAARSAMKGDTTAGKGLRMLFLLGAAEIGMKEITGRGLIDRAHLFDTMGEAIEGTYEAVLVQRGIEGVNEEQHTAALYELNTVPFHVAMNWYENTNPNGDPSPGQESNIKDSWSKMKVDVDRVCPAKVEWKEKDREREAKIILKKTMEQFFGYVAEKDKSSGPNFAKEALKERWIKDTEDPNFTKAQAKYTHDLPTELTDTFHGNQNALTWQMVMRAEIDPADVEKTVGQTWQDRVKAFAEGKLAQLERWGRQDVLGWLGPAAANFWNELGNKAEDVKAWLGEMGDKMATNLYFTKEKAVFWYEGNRHEIRHFMDDHIELIVDGIKLPFALIYAADKAVVPWTTTKIRQFREILRPDTLTTSGQPLAAADIVGNPALLTALQRNPNLPISRNERDVTKNPQFKYFGYYQRGFLNAFQSPDKFYAKDQPNDLINHRVGYFISEVSKEDVDYKDGKDPALMMSKLQAKANERAEEAFADPRRGNAPVGDIRRFMYPIHFLIQRDTKGTVETPEKLYVFYRMPLPGSEEYALKTMSGNRWTDYMDPNQYKHRPPFILDPRAGLVENLEKSLGLKLEGTREVAGAAGKFIAQWIKLPLYTAEQAGKLAHGALALGDFKKPGEIGKWIDELLTMKEDKKQWLDEKLSSAGSADLAISDFYKDPVNAWWYEAASEYSQDTQQDLWLANNRLAWKKVGDQARQNPGLFVDKPTQFNDNDFLSWIRDYAKTKKVPPAGVKVP